MDNNSCNLEERVANCELNVEAHRHEIYAKVVECETKISNLLPRGIEAEPSHLNCSSSCIDQGYTLGNRQVKEFVEEAVNQQQLKDKEIEACKQNIILYNILENMEERHDVRLTKDKNFIVTMCDDVAGTQVTDQDISKCIRLGAFEDGKTRPVLPIDWRRDNVSPIHKKGSRVQAENYRPISLTSQLCKVFEFIMRVALVNHLEKLCLLCESQHGFR